MNNKKIPIVAVMIALLVLSILISLSVYFGLIRNRVDQLYFEDAYANNQETTSNARLYFEAKLDEQISIIKNAEVTHHNIENDEGIFDDTYYETVILYNEYIKSVEVFDNDGIILYSSLEDENRLGINISNYPLVKEIDKEHETHIGRLEFNPTFDELCLEVIYSGEEYSIFALISVGYFTDYGEEFKTSYTGKEIMILNENGIILYDSYNEDHLIQRRFSLLNDLTSSQDSEFQTMIVNDKESIISYDSIDTIGGYIVIYETLDSALHLSDIMDGYYTIIIFIIILIFISVFTLVFYRFNKELTAIITNFAALGIGQFDERLPDSIVKEFSVVRHAFNDTSVKIKSLTDSLEYIAYHDQLTGLSTRNKAELDFKVLNAKAVAFIYIDIVRFTLINENYGFSIGNEVLKDLAIFLESYSEYVYRVEGDEFLILKQYDDFSEVSEVISRIQEDIKKVFTINSYRISVKLKIAVSTFPESATDFVTLLQNAFTPLHFYKRDQTEEFLLYDKELSEVYNRSSKVELLLNNTNISKEFQTVYQPIVEAKTGLIRGFECLSRWYNKELGQVSPGDFVGILEKTRRVHLIDYKVLLDALRISKFIYKEYGEKLVASVNMSVYSIMRDDFISTIESALEKFDYDPHYLELEITESAFIEDFEAVSSKVDYLKSKGIKFSEDDFGEAYSSLTYLTKLNIDTLKISRMFLLSILDSVQSRILVKTIIELSKSLGFYTIVEGVEDEETLALFKGYGCDFIQGYLFYKPMKETDLIQLFDSKKREDS